MPEGITCKQDKCKLPVKAGGYCITHYRRSMGWNAKPMDAPIIDRKSKEWDPTPLRDRIKPGDKFNRLTVIEYAGQARSGAYTSSATFKIRCDCGKEFVTHGSRMVSGNTKSCGCLHLEQAQARALSNNSETSLTLVYGRYRHKAGVRGLEFTLTRTQFQKLALKACHYCGSPPGNTYLNPRSKARTFNYSGVDRKDSSKGYTPRNTVACCITCNRAKSDMTYREFLTWIERLITFSERL